MVNLFNINLGEHKMKITKTKLKEMIREELLNERYIDPDDAGIVIVNAIDDLEIAIKRVKNPEQWAEKYHRSLPGLVDMIERITKILQKMK